MNFCIDGDFGTRINGWLTPDNPSIRPRFIVEAEGFDPIEFDANVLRSDLFDLGWHSTGQVGFEIDDNLIPDIDNVSDIRVTDAHTGITIYRRFPPGAFRQLKLVLYDCSAMPQWRMLRQIAGSFGLVYNSIDRLPLETTLALLWSNGSRSSFVNGSPNFLRYADAIRTREFMSVALLRPPVEELAERLLFLRMIASSPSLQNIRSLFSHFEPLITFASALDITNRKSLISSFRSIDSRARVLMRSPMTHTFGAEVTDSVEPKQVSFALDNLSTFNLVGTRSRFGEFCAIFDGLIGDRLLHGASLSQLPGVEDLTSKLTDIGPVIDLLEEDLNLYAYVEEAVQHREVA
ncbi:MAG: hypothetical protein CFE31_19355 [Rhizobiales bacterium PAR1]|nr:MAG: hypothetical protein CFE31_19355 [Rhizobiales bacterium PAR1]